jgi:hypothetical protein
MKEIQFEKVNEDIQIYPEEFKRKVVEEYLAGSGTKMHVAQVWNQNKKWYSKVDEITWLCK